MSSMTMKVLSVYHIGDSSEEDAKLSFSPAEIKMIASRDVKKNGRDLKDIQVFFCDGDIQMFTVSGLDLMTLEQVVAGYSEDY